MTFKRNWDYTKKGCVSLFKPENSACHTMAVDCLALKAGGHYKGKWLGTFGEVAVRKAASN